MAPNSENGGDDNGRILVEWDGPHDPAAPRNWPKSRKWLTSSVGFVFCGLASISVSGYSISVSAIQAELRCSRLLALAGISTYTVMFGVAPLLLAPLSEIYGRRIVYLASTTVYTLFQIPQALAPNITTMLVVRAISGMGGSTAISLLGGILGDLFSDDERGLPMAVFAFFAFAPTGLGPVMFGYVAMLRGSPIVFWVQFTMAGLLTLAIFFVQAETRESVLLARKASALRKSTGNSNYAAPFDLEQKSFLTMIRTNLSRPLHLLAVEPVIQAWTVYVAFAWGVLYLLLLSIPIVYSQIYGFNLGEIGLTYISQILGAVLAMPISLWCDRLYRRNFATTGAEGRMYAGMAGGVLVSIGAWQFAWTSWSSVHWIVPLIGITILYSGLLQIYQTAFAYVTAGYTLYAASALAALNLGRNLVAAAVPLFGNQVYEKLGIHGAGSLVAGLATVLALVPFIIFKYGSWLRSRSKFSLMYAEKQ